MHYQIRWPCRTLALLLGLALLSGCEAQKPPSSPQQAQAQPDSITRATAIQSAQRDAAFRYSEVRVARVDARRQGGFWVVELTSMTGSGVRYTISALDGSIRERNMFQ
jgi:hypothetical protein